VKKIATDAHGYSRIKDLCASVSIRGVFILSLIVFPLAAQKPDDCRTLRHHGKLPEARTCFARLASNADPAARAEGLWGLEQYKEANEQFREALKAHPKSVEIRVRWGRLFLERFNKDEAKGLFQEALEIKENDASANLGLALVAAESYSSAAVHFATHATELDPKMAEAHE
jgi:tetratricopeptide (TPR) repeat protein